MENAQEKLLPCPFCGGTDIEISCNRSWAKIRPSGDAHLWCNTQECEGIDVYADTVEEIIKLWNRRCLKS